MNVNIILNLENKTVIVLYHIIYIHFEGAKIIHVLEELIWRFKDSEGS